MNHRINLLRSIAIFLVLLQHVSSWCQFYSPSPFVNIVYTSIATTGVPIFIMITGALLLPKYDEPIKVFFKKRINKIFVPFICWSYIYLIYQKYIPLLPWQRVFESSDISFSPLILLKGPTYPHLWFVYTIFCIYLTIPLLRQLLKKIPKNLLYYLIVLLIIGSCQQFFNRILGKSIIFSGLNFKIMLDYTVYLILGFIFIQKNYMKRLTVKISVMCLIVGAIGTIVLAKGYVVNGILTNLFWFGDSPFVILTSLGIYGLIMNIDIPTKFNTVVKSISDASFGIFFIHFIPLYLLTLVNISSKGLFLIIDPILGIPIITCILFLICYIIVSIIKKIPFIRIIT